MDSNSIVMIRVLTAEATNKPKPNFTVKGISTFTLKYFLRDVNPNVLMQTERNLTVYQSELWLI